METSIEANNRGRPRTPNRQGLYSQAAKYAPKAIEAIAELLSSKNEAIRLGAAKALLDKCLPDIKTLDVYEEHQNPLEIRLVEDKLS